MKKISKQTFLVIALLFFINWSCTKKSNDNTTEKVNSDSISLNTDNSTVQETKIATYYQIDSLVNLINDNAGIIELNKLETICNSSDGDLSEKLGVNLTKLFIDNMTKYLDFLNKNPNSCLKTSLINGLSSDFAVYEVTERALQIKLVKEKILLKAEKKGNTKDQIKIINTIFEQINPNLLD